MQSGGAFRDLASEENWPNVTVEQALRHPQWDMGAKITIDSSTLVNKGFEVIEALAVRHPGGENNGAAAPAVDRTLDGRIRRRGDQGTAGHARHAHADQLRADVPPTGEPSGERFDFLAHPQLTFAGVDRAKYPALEIACECLRRRGTAACTMNGANEVAVAAFLGRKCAWLDIVRAIEYALGRASFAAAPTLGDYAEANDEARRLAAEYLAL